ncbi:MAG TPA: hypothetical protein VNZ52_03435 [Candidatus Thermoplasmatota archaeon]|nr:hypothetical protein [Candidatus Thermoplasmatota archaeon]
MQGNGTKLSEIGSQQARTVQARPNVFLTFDSGSNVVFYGNSLPVECQRCGAFCSTNIGHKYCTHVTCPIALKEFKRRKRKRTSTLEQVYIPRKLGQVGRV